MVIEKKGIVFENGDYILKLIKEEINLHLFD